MQEGLVCVGSCNRGMYAFGVAGLYPNLLPSSLDETYSVTIHNSASSPFALTIMLVVALVCVPVVIFYQGWFTGCSEAG
jgi:cytochrome bd ubiquinol oxidase subunit II